MWLYRPGKYAEHPIILYEYQPGRSSSYPPNYLQGFKGYLQTDGYVGYDALTDVIHVGCMAHLKRKFHDAVTALPNGKKIGAAVEGEAYCTKLFKLEEAFESLSPEERKEKRQELARPVLDEFLSWGSVRTAAKKSKLGEALTYLHNNGKQLSEYLNDGRLEISNNLAERSIKPFVIDRKNFLFANTPKGGYRQCCYIQHNPDCYCKRAGSISLPEAYLYRSTQTGSSRVGLDNCIASRERAG